MNFWGREQELKLFQNLYGTEQYEGIIVYGRRQIGKSELLKKSFEYTDARCIYYECTKASEETNADNLAEVLKVVFDIPKPKFESFSEAVEYIARQAEKESIVLVIDEYPYVRGATDLLDSKLQKVIDSYKGTSRLKLILCGSYVDVMKSLLSDGNPLYRRFSTSVNVLQMDYYESAKFYEKYSPQEKLEIYSVLGGVPYYNQFVDTSISPKENIINLILEKNGRLAMGPEQTLEQEISKMNNANETFAAIAAGRKKFSDILGKSKVSSSPALASTLNKLITMDVITKVAPINDEREKKAYYAINDRFALFYYKYIFPRKSILANMPPDLFWSEFVEKDFYADFVPRTYESVARQFLRRKNIAGELSPVLYKIGTYYYNDPKNKSNGEFDVVTFNRDGYDFYEVKYTGQPVGDAVVNEEKYQLDSAEIKYNKLGFFSKNGFNITDTDDFILYDLPDLYE